MISPINQWHFISVNSGKTLDTRYTQKVPSITFDKKHMIPIVNDKYKYIFFYNPKCACSVARQLYLNLHRDDFTHKQQTSLAQSSDQGGDEWDNLSSIFPYDLNKDYSSYYKFSLVRHPLTRFVSAYLNRIVINMTDHDVLASFIQKKYGYNHYLTYSFEQFLDYIISTPFKKISNHHYLPQSKFFYHEEQANRLSSAFAVTEYTKRKNIMINSLLGIQLIKLDAICVMESLEADLMNSYAHIFRHTPDKLAQAAELINKLPMRNVTLSNQSKLDNAGNFSFEELTSMKKMPSYNSFLTPIVIEKLVKKYKQDFVNFGYTSDVSKGLLNFEKNKNKKIAHAVPADFDWQLYLQKNPDLEAAGLISRAHLVNHWIHNGRAEGRLYK